MKIASNGISVMARDTNKLKLLIGIQARSDSTRFPGKIYEKIGEKSVLKHVYDACDVKVYPNLIETIRLVLPPQTDGKLIDFCKYEGMDVLQAPDGMDIKDDNLVMRYFHAVANTDADFLIRITSDCPLMDPLWIRRAVIGLLDYDYVTNTMHRTAIDGHDVQGITRKAFEWYATTILTDIDLEHPFMEIEQNYKFRAAFCEKFKILNIGVQDRQILNPYLPENKLSIDTPQDLERVRAVYEAIARKK